MTRRNKLPTARGLVRGVAMNKIETDYARHLELRRRAGEILWWKYEGVRLRLGSGAYYKPDFAVMLADGTIELHETKGRWREAAKVRIKAAAEIYPFRFRAVYRQGRAGWKFEEF